MNIFVTNQCPIKSAQYLDDKRVVKMVLETAQLLCNAHHAAGSPICNQLYKRTHYNHPCSVWVRQTTGNYLWTLSHFKALLEEYRLRYKKVHKCKQLLPLLELVPRDNTGIELTPFANCAANLSLGLSFKYVKDTCNAYKQYLQARWKTDVRTPTWYGKKLIT
jgi:hypothetical protein